MKKYVSLLDLMLRRREKEATFKPTTSSNTFSTGSAPHVRRGQHFCFVPAEQ